MMTLTVEHKHCKCIRVITGDTLYQAFKNNDLDFIHWQVIDIEYMD